MQYLDYDDAWSGTSIAGSSISNAGDATTAEIDNDGKIATEISVEVVYGGTASQGVVVHILRDTDGTNFEAEVDAPFSFAMPYAVSSTRRRAITIPASEISSFKVHLSNDSGASVTATVRYKQAVIASS